MPNGCISGWRRVEIPEARRREGAQTLKETRGRTGKVTTVKVILCKSSPCFCEGMINGRDIEGFLTSAWSVRWHGRRLVPIPSPRPWTGKKNNRYAFND